MREQWSPPAVVDSDVSSRVIHLRQSVESVILGKSDVVTLAIVALVAQGHLLMEDVPGVGKTKLAQALARSLDGSFQRIQFTSDLLPSDIVGVSVFNKARSTFEFKRGPLFANVVLADEINRSTPKTQSALLEAMSEAQVTVDNECHPLPPPFIVLATQNPVEHHGTYPLPESQLDRFLMRLHMGYPNEEDEKRILKAQQVSDPLERVRPVLSCEDVRWLQKEARKVRIPAPVNDYLARLAAATRRSPDLALGVSPRGTLLLQRAAQANALVLGREHVLPDDVKALALPVLAHRIVPRARLSPGSEPGSDARSILEKILESVAVPL